MRGLLGIILMIVGLFILGSTINKCENDLESTLNEYEEKIGDKVVLNKDTLMIVDYSYINGTFTLENGQEINYKLLDNIEYIKK